uniref:PLD-like domain-containing protein n=1 Tax=Sinocyclocheilus rhinocerous TaxID=307959 RepID=A0A673JZH5_9TELE
MLLPYINTHLACKMFFWFRYWSPIDEMLREAAVLREVKVRLLISLWTRTHPLTINFMTSMHALCTGLPAYKEQMGGFQHRINENKFMVTDNAVYIGKTLSLAHTLNTVVHWLDKNCIFVLPKQYKISKNKTKQITIVQLCKIRARFHRQDLDKARIMP